MVGEGGGGGGGGGHNIMAIIKCPPPPLPNCRIQDVTSLALFVHLSGLFISFYFHAFNTKTIVVSEGGGGGGGGSKYYGHYKMTPPPQLQNARCYHASPVCTFEWFIHIILFPCL